MALPIQIPMVDLEYKSDRSLCVRENNSEVSNALEYMILGFWFKNE